MKKILLTVTAIVIAGCRIIAGGQGLPSENDLLSAATAADTPENIVAKNYVGNTIYNAAGGNIANSYTTTQYLDGLGRTVQKVAKGFTSRRNDLVTLYEYDSLGLASKAWLPTYRTGTSGGYMPASTYKTVANTFYNDNYPYVETRYETDPRRRTISETNPGDVLKYKPLSKSYSFNEANDVKNICINDTDTFIEFKGTYPANELYVTESKNADGCRELMYTDKEGKKILARSMKGVEKIDTYFVYDFAGRLTVVITPEGTNEATIQNYKSIAISSTFVDTYCYHYHYDSQGNVTAKHVPGGAYEQMNYDSYGRLWRRWRGPENTYWDEKYLEQYSYDRLNRIKEVSILVMPISEGITASTFTRGPVTMSSYIYDNYTGVPAALNESTNPAFVAAPRGEKTYEKLLLLESNTQIGVLSYYTERAFYYDKEGRLKRTVELNHRGGRSTIDYEYDFQGNTTRRTERIQPLANAAVDVLDVRYTYDHAGRLLTQTTTLNTSDPVTVTCRYNELGQLERKNINGLIMDYTYNLQGWLTGQNSPYYSAELKYYDGEYPSYAGNITEWIWGGAGTMPHTYKYKYDKLARMTEAWYSGDEGAHKYSESNIFYDRNGNIRRINRGMNEQRLVYTYEGNRLQSVNNEGFEYDNCGNMTKDMRNDLNITYNFLNLPWQVYRISNPNARTLYSYLPDGTKLSAVDQTGNGLYYVGSLVYTGGRTNAQLESADFGDGRFNQVTSYGSTRYLPVYYLKDHLGSPRALCDHTGKLIALRDYYPFGKAWSKPNAPVTANRNRYNGKELQWVGAAANILDYGARFYNPDLGRWLTQDPLAAKFVNINSYTFCGNSPICYIDPDGLAWRPTYTTDSRGFHRINGFEWVPDEEAYDELGRLKEGLYEHAMFFSYNGNFDASSGYNMGSSTLTIYLPDGTTMTFDACTNPSSPDYPTVPEGIYHATKGMHNGSKSSYSALRLSDTDNSGRIELGSENPAHPERTYAEGINIHKPGKNNKTGIFSDGSPASAGCLLVDINRWNEFIGIFNSCKGNSEVIGVAVSRSLPAPINNNILPAFNFYMSGTLQMVLKKK